MIWFVGAGSGAVDLITVRGERLLRRADCVVYAGSLVNPELLTLAKPDARRLDSSGMTLEELLDAMLATEREGGMTVRLHSGDPSLYGAIREQMDRLDAAGVPYGVVPGVSSFAAAAASLAVEYTPPGVSQTLIISRLAGRTPVPDAEDMALLAGHGCSMAVFLSSGMLDALQEKLLAGGYRPDTPAAIVHRASWPDEKVYRCRLGDLAATGRTHTITRTALVLVGDFLDAAGGRSRLYDPDFTTGYRKGRDAD